jgi:hypothetical protein
LFFLFFSFFLFCLSRRRYLVITCAGRLIYTPRVTQTFLASFLLELSQLALVS